MTGPPPWAGRPAQLLPRPQRTTRAINSARPEQGYDPAEVTARLKSGGGGSPPGGRTGTSFGGGMTARTTTFEVSAPAVSVSATPVGYWRKLLEDNEKYPDQAGRYATARLPEVVQQAIVGLLVKEAATRGREEAEKLEKTLCLVEPAQDDVRLMCETMLAYYEHKPAPGAMNRVPRAVREAATEALNQGRLDKVDGAEGLIRIVLSMQHRVLFKIPALAAATGHDYSKIGTAYNLVKVVAEVMKLKYPDISLAVDAVKTLTGMGGDKINGLAALFDVFNWIQEAAEDQRTGGQWETARAHLLDREVPWHQLERVQPGGGAPAAQPQMPSGTFQPAMDTSLQGTIQGHGEGSILPTILQGDGDRHGGGGKGL